VKLRILDLFSGIGGFSLGLERTGGFETVAFCEIEPFPRKVLAKHWPGVPCYEDVRTLTGERLAADGIAVDVITGGFPCQDISIAGKKAGIGEGTRSGLWSEIVRLIGDLQPRYVIVENVANLLSGPSEKRGGWFGRILGDLAECGYNAEWENIPAAALGAPHRRERVWLVAYPNKKFKPRVGCIQVARCGGGNAGPSNEAIPEERGNLRKVAPTLANANSAGPQGRTQAGNSSSIGTGGIQIFERCANLPRGVWRTEPRVGRVANGIPDRAHRLKGLGNAVVPQIPELIGRAILSSIARADEHAEPCSKSALEEHHGQIGRAA